MTTDDDLDRFVGMSRPVQAGIALTSAGVLLGSVANAWPAVAALVQGGPVDPQAAIWLVLDALLLGVSVFAGYNGARSLMTAERLAATIKARTLLPLVPEGEFVQRPSNGDISGGSIA